jgi:hypothetical protein
MFIRMNCFKKKYNLICLFGLLAHSGFVLADQCPSTEIIKKREISREYDWSIDERRTLDDLLAVDKLYSVRIKNKGEFIACYYSSNKVLLRLDGAPLEKGCLVNKKSGNWYSAENSELVCKEEDLNQCIYEIHCVSEIDEKT